MPMPCSTAPCSLNSAPSSNRQNPCWNRCPRTCPNTAKPTACSSSCTTSNPSPTHRCPPPRCSESSWEAARSSTEPIANYGLQNKHNDAHHPQTVNKKNKKASFCKCIFFCFFEKLLPLRWLWGCYALLLCAHTAPPSKHHETFNLHFNITKKWQSLTSQF